eukprot:GFUD01036699.1.p1 GENE.GFUD01036699.1~~GFUD01036699.1.p1  ORF type:complete len:192 (+),score=33.64 GFUD01036699.1:43-576(+)
MCDLSPSSVEYVCRHISSPHIARRYGYWESVAECGVMDRSAYRASSEAFQTEGASQGSFNFRSSSSPPNREPYLHPWSSALNYANPSYSSNQDYFCGQVKSLNFKNPTSSLSYVDSLSSSCKSPSTDADLIRKVHSWSKDPSWVGVHSDGNIKSFSNIPKISIYHKSTLEKLRKDWE